MFSKRERRKSNYKSGGTEVCKAFSSKIESFWLLCKLHYLLFGFQIYKNSRLQMFFRRDGLKNFTMFTVKYLC